MRRSFLAFPSFPLPPHIDFDSDPYWRDRARCSLLKLPLKLFCGEQGSWERAIRARKVCRDCDVRMECLIDGMNAPVGIWGGTSYEERKLVKKLIRKGWTIEETMAWVDEGANVAMVREFLGLKTPGPKPSPSPSPPSSSLSSSSISSAVPRPCESIDSESSDDECCAEPAEMDFSYSHSECEQEPA